MNFNQKNMVLFSHKKTHTNECVLSWNKHYFSVLTHKHTHTQDSYNLMRKEKKAKKKSFFQHSC